MDRWKETHREELKAYYKRYNALRRDQQLSYYKEYYKTHRQQSEMRRKKWQEKNPMKDSAGHKARDTIPLRECCEICGAKATDRHHPDYSKPLEVLHLCRACHRTIHMKEKNYE